MLLQRKVGIAADIGEGDGDILLFGCELLLAGFVGLPRLIELLLGGGAGGVQALLPLEFVLLVVDRGLMARASARFWW